MGTYYKPGAWNVICQLCGRQFKSDEVRKRWDGLIVCRNDFENRHILDFIQDRPELPPVPFTSPEPTDTFVGTQSKADVAEADIAKADFNLPVT